MSMSPDSMERLIWQISMRHLYEEEEDREEGDGGGGDDASSINRSDLAKSTTRASSASQFTGVESIASRRIFYSSLLFISIERMRVLLILLHICVCIRGLTRRDICVSLDWIELYDV